MYGCVCVSNGKTEFQLELTWLRDHPQKYDLGECEFHLALAVEDMEKAHALHEKLGCICYENPAMGIYFISDPDGYWIEIIPTNCEDCVYYEYDPEADTNYCEADLDEDEMERFLRSANDSCPFYRPGDEYRTARRQ